MVNNFRIGFKKIHPNAKLPTQANQGDVGFDLYSPTNIILSPNRVTKVDTGIQISKCNFEDASMASVFTKIEGRSGLAVKGIFPIGGIVDSGLYRGNIGVALVNLSGYDYEIKEGDRIAQLVFYKCIYNTNHNVVTITEEVEVDETIRGEKGFGDSGR